MGELAKLLHHLQSNQQTREAEKEQKEQQRRIDARDDLLRRFVSEMPELAAAVTDQTRTGWSQDKPFVELSTNEHITSYVSLAEFGA